MGALKIHLAIECQAVRAECGLNRLGCPRHSSWGIDIINAEKASTAMSASIYEARYGGYQ